MQKPIKQYSDRQVRAALNYVEAQMELMEAFGHVPESAEARLLEKYGECMMQAKAAKVIGCSAATVHNMLADGRLARAGEGRVSTLSVARYLENPRAANYETSVRKRRKKGSYPILLPAKKKGDGLQD